MRFKFLIVLLALLASCETKEPSGDLKKDPVESNVMVEIALVKMEDNGATGEKIGCGDSIVLVEKEIEKSSLESSTKMELALKELFAYGATKVEDEYYNGLQHSSDLKVEKVLTGEAAGKKTIAVYLGGQLISAGTCDDPRIMEQISSTVEANSKADEYLIYINGELLKDYFDMSGGAE